MEQYNAIIVGSGAIGTALAEKLLERPQLTHLVVLQRRTLSAFKDPRVSTVFLDAEKPASITTAATQVRKVVQRVDLMINTVGMLHCEEQQPEKRLSSLETENLQRSFLVNAALLPALVQAFGGLLRHSQPAVFASLSARVGSIEDNQLGGWYSYRASKAAHNMLLRTIAQEWRISHRNATMVALHPGTVHSSLSAPFISANYKHPVRSPRQCAELLLDVLGPLSTDSTGQFYDYQGRQIPW